MYLSRVEIDTHNRRKMRDLKHLGCYHGWIEDAFPEERAKAKDATTRKLWRIDNVGDKFYLLVLSSTKPDLEKLEKYGVDNSASTKDYSSFLASLKEGMRAHFRIKLNTVKSYSNKAQNGRRGRVAPVPNEELMPFFLARTEKNGFAVKVDEFRVAAKTAELFERYDVDEAKRAKQNLVSTTYEGILTITDLEKFKETLTCGIGKKKAYGFGFLTIIPLE